MPELSVLIRDKLRTQGSMVNIEEINGNLNNFPLPATSFKYREIFNAKEFLITTDNSKKRVLVRQRTINMPPILINKGILRPIPTPLNQRYEIIEIPEDSLSASLTEDIQDLHLPGDKSQAVNVLNEIRNRFIKKNSNLQKEINKRFETRIQAIDLFSISIKESKVILLI